MDFFVVVVSVCSGFSLVLALQASDYNQVSFLF